MKRINDKQPSYTTKEKVRYIDTPFRLVKKKKKPAPDPFRDKIVRSVKLNGAFRAMNSCRAGGDKIDKNAGKVGSRFQR